VLCWAGAAKITDRQGWRLSAARHGLPAPVARALPWTELSLGAVLIGTRPMVWSLASATVLLLVFTAYLVVQVGRGANEPCACFGSRMVRPPRWRDVARNIALIALLVTAAATG
jgi:hypothetical protein